MMFRHYHPLPYLLKKSISTNLLYPRYIRTKRGLNPYQLSLRRDERLLKRLEARLADVQAKVKRDEESTTSKQTKRRGASHQPKGLQNHDEFFWQEVLSKDDRRKLEVHGIHSLNVLVSVHNAVEQKLSHFPHLTIESLDAKSRCVYEIYESIPSKLASWSDRAWV